MKEETFVNNLLEQLRAAWDEERASYPTAPPLKEIWGAVLRERSRRGLSKYLSLNETLSLVYEVGQVCFRAAQDGKIKNFDEYYRKVLVSRILRYLGLSQRDRRRRELAHEYAEYKWERHLTKNSFLVQWVRDSLQELPPQDRWFIHQIYWEKRTIAEIARMTCQRPDKLYREHQRVLNALKIQFTEDCWQLTRERGIAA